MSISLNGIKDNFSSFFTSAKNAIGNFSGKIVAEVKVLPATMQQNQKAAIGVFAASSVVLAFVANLVANAVDNAFGNDPALTTVKKVGKYAASSIVMGGVVAAGNYGVSRATNYHVAPHILAAIAVAAVVIRLASVFASANSTPAPAPTPANPPRANPANDAKKNQTHKA